MDALTTTDAHCLEDTVLQSACCKHLNDNNPAERVAGDTRLQRKITGALAAVQDAASRCKKSAVLQFRHLGTSLFQKSAKIRTNSSIAQQATGQDSAQAGLVDKMWELGKETLYCTST